jgi:uncharacterized protein YdaL
MAAVRRRSLPWLIGILLALVTSGFVVFGVTDDSIHEGEGSPWVQRFVGSSGADPEPTPPTERPTLPARFGREGPAETLVLYDEGTPAAAEAELDGIAAANLATHFGRVHVIPVSDYRAGAMADYDAVVYVGTGPEQAIPDALTQDVLEGDTPVLWAGENVEELAGEEGSPSADRFVRGYGWDPAASISQPGEDVGVVTYRGHDLTRDRRDTSGVLAPAIVRPDEVEVLATAGCGDAGAARPCPGQPAGDSFPWAIRSSNRIYVSEVPFDYTDEDSPDLAFADLYYLLLAPETEPVRRAAVRIEDVGPESDPEDLRGVADFLYDRGIPFQVAVIPVHVAKVPGSDPVRWYGLSLTDRPEVVEALRYMRARGGSFVQHGTTHQYGALDNPYDGASAADFEFYRAVCSATEEEPPVPEPCRQDSWIQLVGAVGPDSVPEHLERLKAGRQVLVDAGLGAPSVFEVPHYAASANAYAAIAQLFDARYERSQYFAGSLSGRAFDGDPYLSQLFPYTVHDIYGDTVLPENLGNVTEEEQNNHPARPPQLLLDHARANLAVRESTASFFFHPFLDLAYLDEVVTGLVDLGYEFVPAEDLP